MIDGGAVKVPLLSQSWPWTETIMRANKSVLP